MSFRPLPRETLNIRHYGHDGAFPPVAPGEPYRIEWERKDLKMACCDCGLIHRLRFNVRGRWLIVRGLRAGKLRKGTK